MDHIQSHLPANMDPLQFAYRANQFTEDTVDMVSDSSGRQRHPQYIRVLLVDFSSAFNAILPQQLVEKAQLLEVSTSTCNWS